MATQDTQELKEKIILTFKKRGPCLPVHIASETGQSILFASAFLSELISERKVKTSFMRVGSSPIYFLPPQQHLLEKFSHHLKSKEKDAYLLLKEKKFLIDSSQQPAIRVALRAIKDFALPFTKNEKIIWRFFTVPENEFNINKPQEKIYIEETEDKKDITISQSLTEPTIPQKQKSEQITKDLEIFDKPKDKKPTQKKSVKRKPTQKKNDKFFNTVKEFLSHKQIEIIDIQSFNKNDLILKVKSNNQEKLLIAFNKKRIDEKDILKANKKAQELNLQYIILSLGTPLKKLENLIQAVKNLESIKKL